MQNNIDPPAPLFAPLMHALPLAKGNKLTKTHRIDEISF